VESDTSDSVEKEQSFDLDALQKEYMDPNGSAATGERSDTASIVTSVFTTNTKGIPVDLAGHTRRTEEKVSHRTGKSSKRDAYVPEIARRNHDEMKRLEI